VTVIDESEEDEEVAVSAVHDQFVQESIPEKVQLDCAASAQ